MTNNPDEIRRDIERTRTDLSNNVNALADTANPANAARRKVDQVKDSARGVKERVFGSPDPYDDGAMGGARDKMSGMADDASSMMHDAGHAVQNAPNQVRRSTQGNPLAAGLVAFGLGALIGGLLPSTRKEQELAEQAKQQAQPLMDEAKDMAQDAAEHLKPAAQDAAESVKATAQEGADHVKHDAKQKTDEVKSDAKSSADQAKRDERNPL